MTLESNTPIELQQLLGQRLRRLRLQRDRDQLSVAAKAGVSEKALRNLEAGRGSTVETLLRVLKALDALDGLHAFAPEISVDPMQLLKRPREPQRASRTRARK